MLRFLKQRLLVLHSRWLRGREGVSLREKGQGCLLGTPESALQPPEETEIMGPIPQELDGLRGALHLLHLQGTRGGLLRSQ